MKTKITLLMLLLFTVATSFAQTFTVDGLNYEVTSTTPNEVTLTGSTTAITSLDIPETVSDGVESFTVVAIANSAFESAGLTSVSFPSTLRELGQVTFRFNALESLIIPEGITEIPQRCFSNNTLTSINLPNSIEIIGFRSFEQNTIGNLTLPENVTTISELAFRNSPITTITSLNPNAPSVVLGTSDDSFNNEGNIDLTVPTGAEAPYATAGWTGFRSVNGIVDFQVGTTFTENNFNYTVTSLAPNEVEITGGTSIPSTLVIDGSVSNGSSSFSVIAVGNNAFKNEGITSVQLPNTIITIGIEAFRGNNLSTITIPNSVTTIDANAFRENQLVTVTIGTGVTTIGGNAFNVNFNLQQVTVNATTPPTLGDVAVFNIAANTANVSLTVPTGTEQAYINSDWGDFNSINGIVIFQIGDTFTENNFNYTVTSLAPNEVEITGGTSIPENLIIDGSVSSEGSDFTVTSIGNTAFNNSTITSVTIPAEITSLGTNSFNTNTLTTVIALGTVPATIFDNSLGNRLNIDLTVPTGSEAAYATAGWTGFNTVNGVVVIGVGSIFTENNFNYTITSVNPNEVEVTGGTSIPQNLIINSSVTFEGLNYTVVAVGASAFVASSITNVQLPNTIITIRDDAFRDNQLATLTLPNTVTSIGDRAFGGNLIAGDLVIPNSVTTLRRGAFNSNMLTGITISENITIIEQQTFRSNQLATVTIPANINSLGNFCFRDNPLTEVIVLNTVPPTLNSSDPFFQNRANIALTVPATTELTYLTNDWTGFATINGQDEAVFNQFEVANITYKITNVSLNEVETVDTSLTGAVVIPDSVINNGDTFTVKAIGGSSFRDKQLTSVVIPNTVISIGGFAFSDNNLTRIDLPDNILSIGSDSFSFNDINTIIFSNNITVIADSAFEFNNLSTLTIPAHITDLGSKAFNNNPLNRVVVEGTTPPSIVNGSGPSDSLSTEANIDLFIPLGTSQAYTDANWIGFKSVTEASKALQLKVRLQGASLNPNTGEENLMRDDLRVAGFIPTISPYADNASANTNVFDVTGDDAIVDWIFVELRDANNNTTIIESASALLQRDGDVVGVDGVSDFSFTSTPTDYFVAIKHRNHLGIVLESATKLSSVFTSLDFTKADSPITNGNNVQTDIGMPTGTVGLWSGNVNGDTTITFAGSNAEPTGIKNAVLSNPGNFFNSIFFSPQGYFNEDVNMDGAIKFSGANSEPLFVKSNILNNPGNFFNSIFFTITSQLP